MFYGNTKVCEISTSKKKIHLDINKFQIYVWK